ncbi:unnamed protein product [Vitrella brassicaformis CCMP3155]|uniref:Secreted protein n=1 Tax=Vitrella brassicaformis (strain CCMP3155) TaxID=1169540 RepID=A0A0G4GGP8_VITBC|nr:unnamed protein product [Vitrella brassicaformis CCMP3155]|eukprot:CEM28803.1 unnamed protein product [Vitrella brassicaformis CCMP3155]
MMVRLIGLLALFALAGVAHCHIRKLGPGYGTTTTTTTAPTGDMTGAVPFISPGIHPAQNGSNTTEVGAVRVDRNCDGDPECAASEDIIEFQNPKVAGLPVDFCLRGIFGGCGPEAANYYCRNHAAQETPPPDGHKYTGFSDYEHKAQGCGWTNILQGDTCIALCTCFQHIKCVSTPI